ncbi:uncharacterized protein LOC121374115 [Gigantopelta aegis]|uniref:uncharacterized protein LOC121374115 n=1 Tax=Gigantopelta aegis TaxID=1735272 RepID=UPI001B88BCC5|nr:uncharacterized protein LOC121374115 [Gigantopelta aegis]
MSTVQLESHSTEPSRLQLPLINTSSEPQPGIQHLLAKINAKQSSDELLPGNIDNKPREVPSKCGLRPRSHAVKRRPHHAFQSRAGEILSQEMGAASMPETPAVSNTDGCITPVCKEPCRTPKAGVKSLWALGGKEKDVVKRVARLLGKKKFVETPKVCRNIKALIRFRAIVRSVWHIIRLSAITSRQLKEMEENLDFEVKDQGKVLCFDLQSFKSARNSVNGLSKRAKEAICKPPSKRSDSDIQCLLEIINRVLFFHEYNEHVRSAIAAIIQYDELETGRVVVKQGHQGTQIYFVVSGRLKCYMTETDTETGRYRVQYLNEFTVGTHFGSLFPRELLKRDVTLVCKEPSELLSICKYDVLQILEKDELRQLNQFYNCLKTMPYFKSWTDEQMRECASDAKCQAFEDKEVIIDEYKSKARLHIIENGTCIIVKRLDIVNLTSPYRSEEYLLPEMKSETVFLNKPYGKSLRIFNRESHFLKLYTLEAGDYFNAGERLDNTYIIASGKVDCIQVNHNQFEINFKQYELMKLAETRDYILPNRKRLYHLFLTKRRWEKYKQQLVLEIKRRRNIPSLTTMQDVPRTYKSHYKPMYTESLKPKLCRSCMITGS